MTLDELRAKCHEYKYVLLHLPPPNGQGFMRRLCGRQGPLGEIINGTAKGGQTVRFRSDQVLRHIDKIEAAKAEGRDDA